MGKRKPALRFKGFDGEWEDAKFSDVFSYLQNNTLSRAELSDEVGIAKNIHYGDVLTIFGDLLDVVNTRLPSISSVDVVNQYRSSFLESGDIVIADTAEDETVGKCCEIVGLKNNIVISGLHTIPCRPNCMFGSGYLGYYLNSSSYHNQLLPLMQGTKVASISKSSLADTNIKYPNNLEEQKKLGNLFKQLDALISQQQRKYDSILNVKKSMLEKMFPKDGADVPEIRFKGFSGVWNKCRLGDIVQIIMGQSPDGNTYSETPSDYILVQGNADLKNGWVTPRIWTTQATKKASAGDLIMSVRAPAGTIGKTAYNVVLGRGVAAIKGNEFLYQNLVKMDSDGYWRKLSSGSTFESLNSNDINNAVLFVPSKTEQIRIGTFFKHLDTLLTQHRQKLDHLNHIKSALLEKMFVSEAA